MLEILFLRYLKRKLSELALSKARPASWGWLGVALWILGEIAGFIIGSMMSDGPEAYLFALIGAGGGAGIAYAVVSSLSSLEMPTYGGGQYPAYNLPPPDLNNPYAAPVQSGQTAPR
jgi:hypothetical protein